MFEGLKQFWQEITGQNREEYTPISQHRMSPVMYMAMGMVAAKGLRHVLLSDLHIDYNGKTVQIEIYDRVMSKHYTGLTRCSPNDKFSVGEGIKQALNKAMHARKNGYRYIRYSPAPAEKLTAMQQAAEEARQQKAARKAANLAAQEAFRQKALQRRPERERRIAEEAAKLAAGATA